MAVIVTLVHTQCQTNFKINYTIGRVFYIHGGIMYTVSGGSSICGWTNFFILHGEGFLVKILTPLADKCVQCGACMTACSKAYFKEDDADLARIQVKDVTGLPEINVCSQCGCCIAVCPTQALTRDKNGVVQLSKDKCTGCLMCVGFCPTSSLFFSPKKQPEPYKCIACGLCAKACSAGALILMNQQ